MWNEFNISLEYDYLKKITFHIFRNFGGDKKLKFGLKECLSEWTLDTLISFSNVQTSKHTISILFKF